jgi:hypothetical protein
MLQKYLEESTKVEKVGKNEVWCSKVAPATYRPLLGCHVR